MRGLMPALPACDRGRCPGTPPPGRAGRSGSAVRPGCRDRPPGRVFSITTSEHSRSTSAMLWLASRIVQPLSARYCSSQVRTRSPVSGSRLAVGSSSSSTSGRLISALASATRVFWPADNWPAGRSRMATEVEFPRQGGDPLVHVGDIVEVAIHTHVLLHRQPRRQRDVGRGEIHPSQCGEAVPGHVVAENGDAARGGDEQAQQHGDGGGLAGAIAAQQADRCAGRRDETDVVDRQNRRRIASTDARPGSRSCASG